MNLRSWYGAGRFAAVHHNLYHWGGIQQFWVVLPVIGDKEHPSRIAIDCGQTHTQMPAMRKLLGVGTPAAVVNRIWLQVLQFCLESVPLYDVFCRFDPDRQGGYDRIESMEYIDLRKVGREGLKEIRRQVVRLKKLGKTGKEIEELTGVRQNRASEIWTAYQREGEASLARKKYGRKPGSHMVLTEEEQEKIRKTVAEKTPEDFGITGKLWTLGRTRQYIQKKFHKVVNERTLSDYMKRWGMSCQRPAKRARKQNPTGI